MIEQFLETISKYNLIEKGDGVVVAVSGGPDSISLLHLFWQIKEEYSLKLYAVHLNHQFRGVDAEEDAFYVREFCNKLDIPVFIYSEDVTEYGKKNGMTAEEAGRELRYKYFYEILNAKKANKIAVAQNMDDQAETVLMRLMRGAGIDGLTAIDYKREDVIIRPLLNIDRKTIEKYCEDHRLNPRIDKTNLESIYTRNRVRLELIPYIEKYFNKNIKSTLCRTANLLRADSDFIEEVAGEAYGKIVEEAKKEVKIDIEKLKNCHTAIKNRIIRKGMRVISGELRDVESKHIEILIELINAGKTGSKINLPNEVNAIIQYGMLILKKNNIEESKDFEYHLPVGESLFVEEIKRYITTKVMDIAQVDCDLYYDNKKYFDLNKLDQGMIVRNRRKGDSFIPLGMSGRKKLKDFFIDEKVPREKRNDIPLVCDGEEIMWIVGYRMSNKYKIDKNTKKVLEIELKQEDN